MFFYIQAGLALVGILIVLCGQIRLGERSISRPIMSAIGGALIAPFILCNLLNAGSRLSAAYTARGVAPWEQVEEEQPLDMTILDPAVTFMALVVAGGLVYLGLSTSGDIPYPTEFTETPQERPMEVEVVADHADPTPPDFSDLSSKPAAQDGITASRPREMVTAAPPPKPKGNSVDPSDWDAVLNEPG